MVRKRLAQMFALLFASILIGLSSSSAPAAPTAPLLWGDLSPGVFSVGFRVIYARDHSRNWQERGSGSVSSSPDPGRPIRISLWYPAVVPSGAQPMHYGDYLHLRGPADFLTFDQEMERSDLQSWASDLKGITTNWQQILDKLLRTPVAAVADAPMVRGRFPLVLYAPGLGARGDSNAELAEFLASHGFVVAVVPQLGPWEKDLSLGSSPDEIGLHLSDMEFARSVLGRENGIDVRKIAVIGHSAGGEAALLYAMRHPEVRAAIGLDGSYGFKGGARIMKKLNGYAPYRIRAAILDLRRADGVQGADLDLSVVDACAATDRYEATFQRTYHGDFTEWAPIGLKLSVPLPPNNDGRTRESGYNSNQRAYRSILEFLNAQLRGSRGQLPIMANELRATKGVRVYHEPPRHGYSASGRNG